MRETASRSGDRIDVDTLVPQAGPVGMAPPGAEGGVPGDPNAAPPSNQNEPPAPAGA